MIILREVSKRYGTLTALHPTDLRIGTGKTTALIGPSGCGKSTVLRLVVGLLEPTTGSVEINGQFITPATVQEMRRRMGYVIQDGWLFPHLTAEQNVCLLWRHLNKPETEMRSRLKELCDLTHFPEKGLTRYAVKLGFLGIL
jgi:osmoprotectant transport system ATP-binding protein